MLKYDRSSPKSILEFARLLIQHKLSDFLPEEYTERFWKWELWQLIEEHYFKKPLDNNSGADFPEAWVELKATPLIRLKRGEIRAKERLVLGIINYHEIVNESWENSHFLAKNSLLLLIFYFYNRNELSVDHIIEIVELFSFLDYSDDATIIKNDWLKIQKKILDWKAHELSEGDTDYLGACTKGATALTSLRGQPMSEILAKQRALSFKQSYVNFILKRMRGESQRYESLFSGRKGKYISIEERVQELFAPYLWKTAHDLWEHFKLNYTGQKNFCALLTNRILKVSSAENVEEFLKANIKAKTIRVSSTWTLKEDISFPAFKFNELIQENWEESELLDMLESTKFLFVIFRITLKNTSAFDNLSKAEQAKYLVLEKIALWNAPEWDIDTYGRDTWEKTVSTLKNGVILKRVDRKNDYIIKNNLPASTETEMIHIRPHWSDRDDVDILPDGRTLTKQCFWFNKKYIANQLGL